MFALMLCVVFALSVGLVPALGSQTQHHVTERSTQHGPSRYAGQAVKPGLRDPGLCVLGVREAPLCLGGCVGTVDSQVGAEHGQTVQHVFPAYCGSCRSQSRIQLSLCGRQDGGHVPEPVGSSPPDSPSVDSCRGSPTSCESQTDCTSGAVSGQGWSSPSASGVFPGPGKHTAVSVCVLSPFASPPGQYLLPD